MARRRFVLFACLAALSATVVLTSAPAQATFPGRNGSLAFSAYSLDEESTDILIDREVVGAKRLPGVAQIFGVGSSPAFSPAGGKLAYASEDGARASGIWLARSDCRWPKRTRSAPACSKLRRLTSGRTDESPAWSPSGKRIAFVRGINRIYTVRARGGGLRLLGSGREPDWSSTGAVAFAARGIRVREPDGQVRTLSPVGSSPSWAPGGDQLAFTGFDAASNSDALYTVNADGTGLRKVWETGEGGPRSPTWSPDGRWIAFIKDFQDGYTGWVYAIRPSGQGLRVLMREPKCPFCSSTVNFADLGWQALR